MKPNLSKSQKKIARKLIDLGLRRELALGLAKVDSVIQRWKAGNEDVKESYQEMYRTVHNFDKHIAQRYDYMSGSKYLDTVIYIYCDDLLSDEEIGEFQEDIVQYINHHRQLIQSLREKNSQD